MAEEGRVLWIGLFDVGSWASCIIPITDSSIDLPCRSSTLTHPLPRPDRIPPRPTTHDTAALPFPRNPSGRGCSLGCPAGKRKSREAKNRNPPSHRYFGIVCGVLVLRRPDKTVAQGIAHDQRKRQRFAGDQRTKPEKNATANDQSEEGRRKKTETKKKKRDDRHHHGQDHTTENEHGRAYVRATYNSSSWQRQTETPFASFLPSFLPPDGATHLCLA